MDSREASEEKMDADATSDESRPQTVEIDLGGDVVLEVGPQPRLPLLVSSKVLSIASNAFKALFGPQFREGGAIASRDSPEPYKLPLPDDDPIAMQTLCYLLHHQNQEVPQDPHIHVSLFLDLAIVCDKYLCTDAIKFMSDVWFTGLVPGADLEQAEKLLVISYLLDEPSVFRTMTNHLLLNTIDGHLHQQLECETDDVFPVAIYMKISRERAKLLHILSEGLQEPVSHFISKQNILASMTSQGNSHNTITHSWHDFCLHDSFVVSAYIRELNRLGLWPLDLPHTTIATVLESLEAFEAPRELASAFGYRVFGRNSGCQACVWDHRAKIEGLIDEVSSVAKGLCLDCERQQNRTEGTCRVTHDWEP